MWEQNLLFFGTSLLFAFCFELCLSETNLLTPIINPPNTIVAADVPAIPILPMPEAILTPHQTLDQLATKHTYAVAKKEARIAAQATLEQAIKDENEANLATEKARFDHFELVNKIHPPANQ